MLGWKKRGLLPSCLLGLGAAAALTALLCLAMTPLIMRGAVPLDRADILAQSASFLSVFAAVLFLAKSRGRQAMPTAGIVAGGYILLAALLCALGGRSCAFGPWLLREGAAATAGALLGAVMSIRQPQRRRRKRR